MDFKYIERLAIKSKEGDEHSKELLSEEFKPLIINLANKYHIPGYDFNDLMGECYKSLFIALEKYQTDKHRFVAFATVSIQNSLKVLLRNSKRREEKLITSEHLDDSLEDEDNFEEGFCDKDFKNFVRKCFENLKDDEQEFVKFVYFQGKSVRAFAMRENIKYNQARLKNRMILQKLRVFLCT